MASEQNYQALHELADELEDVQEPGTPGSAQTQPAVNEKMLDAQARNMAKMAIMPLQGTLSLVTKTSVTIPDKAKEDLTLAGAEVIKKHCKDGNLPPWLLKWQEELQFAMLLGGTVYGAVAEAKKQKAEEAKARPAKAEVSDGNQ